MIAPTPLQCDSPKVVTRKIVPKVDMPLGYGRRARRAKGLRSSGLNTTIMRRRPMVLHNIAERLASSLIGIKLSGSCCLCCSCCGAITPTEPLAAIVLTAPCEGSRRELSTERRELATSKRCQARPVEYCRCSED